jgi:hypothetical protein
MGNEFLPFLHAYAAFLALGGHRAYSYSPSSPFPNALLFSGPTQWTHPDNICSCLLLSLPLSMSHPLKPAVFLTDVTASAIPHSQISMFQRGNSKRGGDQFPPSLLLSLPHISQPFSVSNLQEDLTSQEIHQATPIGVIKKTKA